jgi:hypothetical protein
VSNAIRYCGGADGVGEALALLAGLPSRSPARLGFFSSFFRSRFDGTGESGAAAAEVIAGADAAAEGERFAEGLSAAGVADGRAPSFSRLNCCFALR